MPPGERAAKLLSPFLDANKYSAVAVVHGMGARAPKAFDLAKQRLAAGLGVVWVTDDALIDELVGPEAKTLKKVFAPTDGCLMTFFSVQNRKVVTALKWWEVNLGRIDQGYLDAGLN